MIVDAMENHPSGIRALILLNTASRIFLAAAASYNTTNDNALDKPMLRLSGNHWKCEFCQGGAGIKNACWQVAYKMAINRQF